MHPKTFLPVLLGLQLSAVCLAATPDGETLRVGISPFAPFVMFSESGEPSGFSIDLWEEVAKHLDRPSTFVRCTGVAEKLERIHKGELDAAIGGITITAEREEGVDFTHTHFRTGLDILVPATGSLSVWGATASIWSRGKLMIVGSFVLLIVLAGHLMWFAERGKDMFNDKYFPGVFEGMYWAVVTASTVGYGDKAPVKWAGRALAAIVIIAALPMFALFTAELTSTFTVQGMQTDVRGADDLKGKNVGVVRGTTSEECVRELKAHPRCFAVIDEAYAALARGDIDAVVYDAPSLQYYVQYTGSSALTLVNDPFRPQDLGFAVQSESPRREELNKILLTVTETGELDRLKTKWFGSQ